MECLAPSGGVYQAGTFSGNPVVMRAGLATLKLLNKDFYASLNKRTEEFALNINQWFQENGTSAHMSHYKSMMSIRFRKEPVDHYKDAQDASSGEVYGRLFRHLLKAGIYWPPADLESFFVSGMHTKKDLAVLAETLKTFFIN